MSKDDRFLDFATNEISGAFAFFLASAGRFRLLGYNPDTDLSEKIRMDALVFLFKLNVLLT